MVANDDLTIPQLWHQLCRQNLPEAGVGLLVDLFWRHDFAEGAGASEDELLSDMRLTIRETLMTIINDRDGAAFAEWSEKYKDNPDLFLVDALAFFDEQVEALADD